MFEDLIKELERMNGQSVSIPIHPDEKGYIDKQCPEEACEFIFKVNEEDWGNIFKDEAVWCPMCRHEAPADQWFTIGQVEHAKEEAFAIAQGKIHNAMRSGAEKFNRKQPRNSVISMSMKVTGGPKRTHVIPAKAAELMQLEIQCEECRSRFSVIGSAYFHQRIRTSFPPHSLLVQSCYQNKLMPFPIGSHFLVVPKCKVAQL